MAEVEGHGLSTHGFRNDLRTTRREGDGARRIRLRAVVGGDGRIGPASGNQAATPEGDIACITKSGDVLATVINDQGATAEFEGIGVTGAVQEGILQDDGATPDLELLEVSLPGVFTTTL